MCGFMPPPGLPKRMAGLNNFIAVIAVTWACFKSGCARSSTRCAKGYAFRSGSSYPSTRSELRKRRTDFLYGSELCLMVDHFGLTLLGRGSIFGVVLPAVIKSILQQSKNGIDALTCPHLLAFFVGAPKVRHGNLIDAVALAQHLGRDLGL